MNFNFEISIVDNIILSMRAVKIQINLCFCCLIMVVECVCLSVCLGNEYALLGKKKKLILLVLIVSNVIHVTC